MLYNTGNIAINGNNATGNGTNWTAPASQIRAGQTILVLSNPVQMFQIITVNSATSLTVTPAASPALTGQKYGILVTDGLSVDGLAQSISQLINEYDENIGAWESFASTTANQNVTVTINGVSVTIPAIGKLLQKGSNGALPINQGGTGATTKEDARTNLGLGDSATKTVGIAAGNVMQVGAFGLGSLQQNKPNDASASFISDADGNTVWAPANGCGYQSSYTMQRIAQMWVTSNGAGYSRFLTNTNPQTPKTDVPWTVFQAAGTSDINFKKVTGELDLNESLSNIETMDFKTFYYLADEDKTVRRGVIAQELEKVDPQYVHSSEESGKMTLDLNPLVLDALAAIKALAIRVRELEANATTTEAESFFG
ncbi:tail fiber domain-containing protein [Lelliottia amnigena]|uniref:tail fiber domain-containing protein n=2 Tax=Lelliottia amnigena TaxID=61646 RepID=UPI0021D86A7A|nr:tail fiber domain-containing protein [Lelliottia amnigena]MCU7781937.1 tail fiber domain-containing protein [Lelliottia amnigena]